MPHQLTEEEVIAYAKGEGCSITSEQLKRWRKFGVFPRPSRHGLGRGRGTASYYPEVAGRWAVDLAKALAGKGNRSLSRAAWRLWIMGYPLTHLAREQIGRLLPQVTAVYRRFAAGDFDLSNSLAKRGRKHPLISAGARMLAGESSTESDAREAWPHLDGLFPGAQPKPDLEWLRSFTMRGEGVSLDEWGKALLAASDTELERVRDELLVMAFVSEMLGDETDESEISPVGVLTWYGLSQVAPHGASVMAYIRSAINEGRVPQLVSEFRPIIPMIRSARKTLAWIEGGARGRYV
jgi:hypothetical protein